MAKKIERLNLCVSTRKLSAEIDEIVDVLNGL
jgi:hypothetical protein